jgi:hypothetical protein
MLGTELPRRLEHVLLWYAAWLGRKVVHTCLKINDTVGSPSFEVHVECLMES